MAKSVKQLKRMKFRGKCMYAIVKEPRLNKGKGRVEYSIDIEVTDKDIEEMIKLGVGIGKEQFDKRIKTHDGDKSKYMCFNRPAKSKDEKYDVPPLQLKGPDGKDFDKLVGNGSEVIIWVDIYESLKFKGKVGARLVAVQVVKHVPYGGSSGLADSEFEVFEESKEDSDDSVSDDEFLK